MKRKIWMVFPSHNQEWAKAMIGTLEHIEDFMKQYEVRVLVHAQWPHTQDSVREMKEAFLDHGAGTWKDIYSPKSVVQGWRIEELGCPISSIRNTCFRGTAIDPGNIIFSLDDDFRFSPGTRLYKWSSGDHYSDVIEYMWSHERCGSVMAAGHLGGSGKGREIYPKMGSLWSTNRGLFFRRLAEMKFPLLPAWALRMRGALEEVAMVYARITHGFYGAKTMNCPTIHNITGAAAREARDNPLHHVPFEDLFLTQYVRERWDQPDWNFESRKIPRKLGEEYLAAGGSPKILET